MEMRDAFAAALVELGQELPRMIVLDADLHTSSKTSRFKEAFPDRFIQVGIAEQDLFGIAAGLALEGFQPVPSTFAVFAARRALDQIAISIAYPALDVTIPGSYVGLPTSRAGASHNCIEDIAVMRALPNMRVADPGDNADLRAVLRTAMQTPGPVYVRVTRLTVPDMFGADHAFEWGTGATIIEGSDVTLFGTGVMTSLCVRAADELAADGIHAEVVHLASIKPIDADLVVASATRTGCAVTAENANILGGVGSAVTEVLAERAPVPVQRIGVRDRWVDSGGIDDLFTHHGMQPRDIAAAARRSIAARDGRHTEASR
jgi:transketolase